ncbi:MAG: putative nuclease SbcD, partial [Chthonomonadales bacterium]|nr:putative nuclease SbcD [Chthonomonadales bacterium]
MITAIVTSDNHLGAYYARFRPERLGQRRRRLQEGFGRVVDAALERRVDLFLHAGDLFDRPDPRNAERHFVASQFKRLQEAGIPVLAIAGNHDSPRSFGYDGGVLPQEEMHVLDAVHLFKQTDMFGIKTLTIRGQQVAVRGMSSDFNLPENACPLEGMGRQQRAGDIDLTLLHYSVEGWGQPFAQEPCLSLANLAKLETDAICVGHLHRRNETRLPRGAVLLNPGATEHINFGEESLPCGYWLLTCQAGQVETEYIPLPTQPMQTLELDLSNLPTAEAEADDPLMEMLLARVSEVSRSEQLLRVQLKGRLPRTRFQSLDLSHLLAHGNAGNFHCQLETDHLTVFDPMSDIPIGFGVSFDAGEELQNTAKAFAAQYADNETESEICCLAAGR